MGVIATVIAALLEFSGVGIAGYALYRSGNSGQEIYAGSLQSQAGPIRSFEIDLDPDMSPVSFAFAARVDRFYARSSSMNQSVSYTASLTLDGRRVMAKMLSFTIEPDEERDGKRRQVSRDVAAGLDWFDVPAAGRYQFTLVPQGASEKRAIQNISVAMRRNVEGVNRKQMWWGVGLILAGGLIQFLFGAPLPWSKPD